MTTGLTLFQETDVLGFRCRGEVRKSNSTYIFTISREEIKEHTDSEKGSVITYKEEFNVLEEDVDFVEKNDLTDSFLIRISFRRFDGIEPDELRAALGVVLSKTTVKQIRKALRLNLA